MKHHTILKTFPGSQTGHDHHQFEQGTTVPLSDDLAAVVVPLGWAEPAEAARPGNPALSRETKVVEPEEAKAEESDKPLDDMNFKELLAAAKAKGIKTFGMSEEKLLAALKA